MESSKSPDSIGTVVFSKVTASVSHELKNAFAIINENAGLLEDLMHMAPPDKGIDPNRLQSVIAIVNKQVARANRILKDVNTFAHSADHPVMEADLDNTLGLVVSLARRQADMKKINLEARCHEKQTVKTSLFTFESTIYLLIQKMITLNPSEDTITLEASLQREAVEVHFISAKSQMPAIEELVDADIDILLQALDAACDHSKDTIVLRVPLSAS